ncbi:TetR/AcrR family transcriptional regulator [Gordonia sp. (in: high G+C Gram-positive bacteria)]|jgi:AcrR family transcriptional regulator|uniref:TetR/AcrR family transcriptional regulator n=3 Tax=Gordonia sp. (in: high G+C Gram-positive bacteria) TaxID=84139 RepID=UPI00262C4078|nr:TetR/AcrR family transcriptional regulator [Gordonia sp. (in: high G+C Gram-positive bacteria)]HMS76014.1 TetR/AcrR family transcriptional regulator [Gordonia sp. (in: high G+C Gram-positive bacteria)]HQV20063.1 TetR/AcrR family transcriptional regulator [Gordonia sp. (in: high G+C Gram-positive bacteria)]
MEQHIRALGRSHLRTHGAAGLSLRAIARELGVVSSAVYRYVPSRDDLLTMLLVEGYADLADAVDTAVAQAGGDDPEARLLAAATTVRRWAVDDPARWALLYGSPVPGYAAPAEQTVVPGTRVVATLLRELADAHARGLVRDDLPDCAAAISADLSAIRDEFGLALPDPVIAAGSTVWAALIGAVSLEVFGQYGTGTFRHPEMLFEAQVRLAMSRILLGTEGFGVVASGGERSPDPS